MWLKRRREESEEVMLVGKVHKKIKKTLVFCGQGAFQCSAGCCGLRFCYVWRPTPNLKCPTWTLPERMTPRGAWAAELVKLIYFRYRTVFSSGRSKNSIKNK